MARRPGPAATLLLLLLAAVAVGCTRAEPPPPPLDVSGLPGVRLAVQAVEVENQAALPADQDFIARRRSGQLADDAAGYLRARVEATGGGELFARATVEEARLFERGRETSGGAGGLFSTGLFSTEPDWEMVGVLALKVAVVDGLGIENGFASSRAEIRRSLSRRASVEAKDRFTRELTNDLIAAAGRDLDRSVQQNLASYRAP